MTTHDDLISRIPFVWPENLIKHERCFTTPWSVLKCKGKYYLPVIQRLVSESEGTHTVPITYENGVITVGKGYDTPIEIEYNWLTIQGYVEVQLTP